MPISDTASEPTAKLVTMHLYDRVVAIGTVVVPTRVTPVPAATVTTPDEVLLLTMSKLNALPGPIAATICAAVGVVTVVATVWPDWRRSASISCAAVRVTVAVVLVLSAQLATALIAPTSLVIAPIVVLLAASSR